MIIRKHAYARAGLLGNPSDGYFGKTISVIVRNYRATVTLYESPMLEILLRQEDHSRFGNLAELVEDVRLNGYYGGVRLIKATIKKFADYCAGEGVLIEPKNFTVEYESNIPRQVGLAGSSAIITATLRCLMEFYGVEVAMPLKPNLILSVETEELGLSAGLQDRVIQVYEGVVYMDFGKHIVKTRGHGHYEAIGPKLLPPLFIAYRTDLSEGSEKVHNDIRARFNKGDRKVVRAMKQFASLAEEGKACLERGDFRELGRLMDANFDLRAGLYTISERNLDMVQRGRAVGANVKFSGSGGAVIGRYEDERMYKKLVRTYKKGGYHIFKPIVRDRSPHR
ncbi:MAG: GHMP kinase [Planctomycetes bacterium]|nr:GHMP kinase [Planctomycetota bacterium]